MGISLKTPFRFTQLSWSPSVQFLSLKHQQAHSVTPNNSMNYCIHIRVTLGEGRDDQPQPSHTWNGSLIANTLQEACPRDYITEAVVLALGEAILFYGRHSCNEGLLYRNTQDVELHLRGPITKAGITAQEEATVCTMLEGCRAMADEGCRAMADAIMEKKIKTRGPGHPQGSRRAAWPSAAICYINNLMQGLDEGASDEEVSRIDDIHAHGQDQSGSPAQCVDGRQ